MTRYLEQECEGGICNFGPLVEMTRCLQAYRGQALVIFDFPLDFEWFSKKSQVSVILELFSEYGSYRRSTMYQGLWVQNACHVLVFSNVAPIDGIAHRRIEHIEADAITEEAGSQESTLVMGPRFDPMTNTVRELPRGRSRSRSPGRGEA